MLIQSSKISFAAAHQQEQRLSVTEQLNYTERRGDQVTQLSARREMTYENSEVSVFLQQPGQSQSEAANELLQHAKRPRLMPWARMGETEGNGVSRQPVGEVTTSERDEIKPMTPEEFRVLLLKETLYRLFGISLEEQESGADEVKKAIERGEQQGAALQAQFQPTGQGDGFQLDYHYEQQYYEAEFSYVEAHGQVLTADGQQLDFSVQVGLSREFFTSQSLSFSAGNLKDPLVIEFGGTAAQLGSTRFAFDLTLDGQLESLSTLGQGRGFLAWDRNDDGVINDGSELFGAQTGRGFAELTALDDDGNGWIDQGDSRFSQLRVWMPDESGQGQLYALADLGIGAIYLDSIESPFRYTDARNNTLGELRETGIYLREDGQAGLVRQIDLSV
ncbi:MAG: hypothetical protein IBX50_18545 [Marinospirillum sp.]|uniref:hypothetical protein n=1 Tax=Marinospirillum sp. TaxID=2183934 RepID=UPI0019FBF657|nr:hypothetical protein [Marinospirillum sp.]MBE0508687.1 hypothetical protein [Marinospirillum sp.]